LTPECGKLTTAIAQIYLDQEIDIEAGYAKLEILPNYNASKSHPLNVMARSQYLEKAYQEEFDSTLTQIDLYERGLEKHAFLQKVFKILKKPVPEYLSDYIFGQIDDKEMDMTALHQTAEKYVKKLIASAESEELKEKLELLLSEVE
jgi:Ca2+-binding EF-hand superfamily protein